VGSFGRDKKKETIMGIEESDTRFYNASNDYGYGEAANILYCDSCGRECGCGRTPGEAADAARKQGARTVSGKKMSDPLVWNCKVCQT
jgi:hypothetical protein